MYIYMYLLCLQPLQSLADRYARRLKKQGSHPELDVREEREPSSEPEASFILQADALQVRACHTHMQMHARIHTRTSTVHMHTCRYSAVHIHVHACTHVCESFTHTHTHTHTQSQWASLQSKVDSRSKLVDNLLDRLNQFNTLYGPLKEFVDEGNRLLGDEKPVGVSAARLEEQVCTCQVGIEEDYVLHHLYTL